MTDFFTPQVREDARPVASLDDDSGVANCCESKVYNVVRDAKLRDKFFIKSQPYSVLDMLAHDPSPPTSPARPSTRRSSPRCRTTAGTRP